MAHTEDVRLDQRRALLAVLAVNAGYMIVEVVGGVAFSSLALLADAAHMLSDVVALSVALIAHRLIERPASARHTYGLQRAEVLGALVNGLILLGIALLVAVEAFRRLDDPQDVVGGGLLAVAAIGLAINLVSARVLDRARRGSLNLRAAMIHMLSDAAGSVAALVAGAAVLLWDATWTDPAASLAIAALVLYSAWHLLRDTVHVLLEGTPRGMDTADVERAINDHAGVESIHHLHLWNLASDVPALSAHVVLADDMPLHEVQIRGDKIKEMLASRFGIEHATLEFECHACDPIYETERPPDHAP
ncbi:MAG: cation diffusion facilitator family transporter [Actinomycetota bacterium]